VIAPSQSFDYSFIQGLMARDARAVATAQQATQTFTAAGAAQATKAVVTKPVTINFDVGSAALTKKAQQIIDTEMVPFIENNGGAYIEISGHTDSTGAAVTNMALSTQRAQAVAKYLISQWEIPAQRLKIAGYGSTRPICVEPGTNDGLSLDECRALNRSTRTAVLGN
jgi:outer membrane protein OmpA-like peptidoglycan-associated protein